jgi:phosphoglucosamine mutase
MNRALFGTDGIRGKAGAYPLDKAGARQVGKAIATYFAQPGQLAVIGRDPRESSSELVTAVIEGLKSMGVSIEDAGILPTPGLAYLTKERNAQVGIMITASHNAYTDNGIKAFAPGGKKLSDETEAKLNELIISEIADRHAETSTDQKLPIDSYEDFLVSSAGDFIFDGLKIAVDCANGATSGVAPGIFEKLGATVTPLFNQPDGRNINEGCGATDTAALQEIVRQQQLDAGVAFDGDGDRVMIVDEQGRQLSGDHLLYILAVTNHYPGVVATLMSNMGLEAALQKHGITLHRTAVGDRYVLEGLEQTRLTLGGEQSGHIILLDQADTGDGLLVAIRVLKQVLSSGKSLAQWYDELAPQLLPQQLVNIEVPDKALFERSEVQSFIETKAAELGDSGRLNIRPSGTEPKLRIMVEAADADERATAIAKQLSDLIASLSSNNQLTLIEPDDALKPIIINLAIGRDAALENQLIQKSRQPNILKHTPNDAQKRFGDQAMLEKWLTKGREIHWLLGAANDLAGIMWYGKSTFPLDLQLPEIPQETFAIRIYDGYSGHGLAKPFIRQSLRIYEERKQARGEPIRGIWLQTDIDNPAAMAVYGKFGYTEVFRDERRATMILTSEQIRSLL